MEDLIRLSKAQLLQIKNNGFTHVLLENNEVIRVTIEDLCFKQDEIEEVIKKLKMAVSSDKNNKSKD